MYISNFIIIIVSAIKSVFEFPVQVSHRNHGTLNYFISFNRMAVRGVHSSGDYCRHAEVALFIHRKNRYNETFRDRISMVSAVYNEGFLFMTKVSDVTATLPNLYQYCRPLQLHFVVVVVLVWFPVNE